MNTNCLEGLRCPKCGKHGPFHIAISALATVTDDGVQHYGDIEWSDDSYCDCPACDESGIVQDFRTPSDQPWWEAQAAEENPASLGQRGSPGKPAQGKPDGYPG